MCIYMYLHVNVQVSCLGGLHACIIIDHQTTYGVREFEFCRRQILLSSFDAHMPYIRVYIRVCTTVYIR